MGISEDLEKTCDQAEWAWLEPHWKRDAVILVGTSLELLQVAVEIAENQTSKIQSYLNAGTLVKPLNCHVDQWRQSPNKKFKIVIVQPFVLIQE